MTMLGKKLMCALLALMMLLSMAPLALAEEAALRVDFTGMYATGDGEYQAVSLSGVFDVYQGETKVGSVNVVPGGENTITVDGAQAVRLVPVMDTIPAEIQLSEYGYSLQLTAGRLNIAPLTVYANAGLFVVEGNPQMEYALLDADGETVLTFQSDENGDYALDVAIPAGAYTLQMLSTAYALAAHHFEILPYTGADSILVIDARIPELEATATPVPTEAPTATPVPTEAPTATPVPTEAPTKEPTTGTLVIQVSGDESIQVSCEVMSLEGANIAKGTLSLGSNATIPYAQQGEYYVTLYLPQDVVMTALNGNPTIQRGTVRWRVVVSAMQESLYTVELAKTCSLVVPLVNVEAYSVSVNGAHEFIELTNAGGGIYTGAALIADSYTVAATLPAGRYSFDPAYWTMTDNGDGTYTALSTVTIKGGESAVMLPITRVTQGSVSGVVNGLDGKPLEKVDVTLYDAANQAIANAATDKDGAWTITGLEYGSYTVQYASEGKAIPGEAFTIDDKAVNVQLTAKAAKPAKITVVAFMDENNNGAKTKGEGYVKGVEVSLVDKAGTVVTTAVTNKNGSATLSAPAGKYSLRVTAPEHYGFGKKGEGSGVNSSMLEESAERTQVSGQLTLSLDNPLEVGVGIQPMARVTGTVWNDKNADGIWQKDEPGIPGVRVTITGSRNGVSREVVTDENGCYELTQLKKGSYELNCHVPDEYVFTIKAKGDVEKISRMTTEADRVGVDTFSLERGEIHADHNIGMMEGAIIEGVCFLDANFNGVYDEGEKPLPGVEMRLARQSNNVLLQQTVSDENGVYHFYGQRGSTFTIRANLPKGYVFSATGEGENGNRFAANGTKTERRITDITLENGGYMQAMLGAVTYGSISGRVYYDANFSSSWESGEKVGVEFLVTLVDENGEKVIAKRTDKNGNFTFEDLAPGRYMLKMTPEKGYAFTALGKGNVMQTLADGTGLSTVLTLEMGGDIKNAGIGMIEPAKVSGVVFADDNDNGKQDKNEKGLKGVTVRLMSEKGEAAAITVDGSGEFNFNAVLPGKYYLRYELPGDAVFSPVKKNGNAISGENSAGQGEWFTVDVGDTHEAPLCGASLLSNISGVTFADSNGNGMMDADEAFLPGVTIILTPENTAYAAMTVVTGEDGVFAFQELRPGKYSLTVTCPTACVLSRMPKASLGLSHGLTEQTIEMTLKMGSELTGQQLGCVLPSTWTGEAYLDENYDGMRAANEAPAGGETILLLDAQSGETVASVLTDENGHFVIEGIAPGEYELVYVLDEGNLVPKGGDNHLHHEDGVMTTGSVRVNENEDKSGTVVAIARTTEVGGLVWLEKFDGVTPISGAKVYLLDGEGAALAEFTTGKDGKYLFSGLMPGEYALEVTVPDGYTLVESSDPHLAEAGLVSVIDEANGLQGASGVFQLRMAQHQLQMDIGNVLPGRLGDKVWLDLNANGLQDGEEGGIPGVTIELMRGDRVITTAVSDQYGYYCFKNLYPTEYTLRVTWPAEVVPTILRTDIHQISSVLQENGLSIPVTVESNKANYAADLGFVLVEEGKLPDGYGEGAKQIWKK